MTPYVNSKGLLLIRYDDSCCSFWVVIMLLLVHGSLLLSLHVGFGLVPSCMIFFVSFLDARNCCIAVMCYSLFVCVIMSLPYGVTGWSVNSECGIYLSFSLLEDEKNSQTISSTDTIL